MTTGPSNQLLVAIFYDLLEVGTALRGLRRAMAAVEKSGRWFEQ
jgi:hypothetical protein